MTPKNAPQIRQAITAIWAGLPDSFHGWQVWSAVNRKLPKLDVYQDTTLHTMRTLNRDPGSPVKYECINRQESLYRKVIFNDSK